MALDGAYLYTVAEELRGKLIGSRVEKVYQPSKEELLITLRSQNGNHKVLFSANAGSPRVHITGISPENPKQPPMFCMLLRKRLGSGRLAAIRQNGLDRILAFDFETVDDLGDPTISTILIEIMGRHSNILLLDAGGKIVDAIKRVSGEMSSVRVLLPGVAYQAPPAQDKLNLLTADPNEILERFVQNPGGGSSEGTAEHAWRGSRRCLQGN